MSYLDRMHENIDVLYQPCISVLLFSITLILYLEYMYNMADDSIIMDYC